MSDLLLDKDIAGFIETAMAASDSFKSSMISDNSLFEKWCVDIASKVSGKDTERLIYVTIKGEKEKSPLSLAVSAIFTGIVNKAEK